MSDTERLEQFRAALLAAMSLFLETRKDIAKLQIQVVALRSSLSELSPSWEPRFKEILEKVKNATKAEKSAAETELEKALGEVIRLLEVDQTKKPN